MISPIQNKVVTHPVKIK